MLHFNCSFEILETGLLKKLSITLLLCCILPACAHIFHMPKNKAVCYSVCANNEKICQQLCHNNYAQCCAVSTRATEKDYQRHKNEMCVKGGFLALQLNAFRDPLQCTKTTCECKADYNLCIQACNGVIIKCSRPNYAV